MDFMLRFDVWVTVARGSRKAGGSCQQLLQTTVDISTKYVGGGFYQPSAKLQLIIY